MHETDLGSEMLTRLRELMGVEAGWAEDDTRFQWSLWGAAQRGWSEPATGADGWPSWRLQLRTAVFDGYHGSPAQLAALAAEPAEATLAGVVRAAGHETRLELASSLDLRGGGIGWVLWLLAVAGRVQAVEARRLCQSKRLAGAELLPLVDLEAPAAAGPARQLDAVVLAATPQERRSGWSADEIAACVDALRARPLTRAVSTRRGVSASLPFGGASELRSILELTTDAQHPLLGKGLSSVLRAPAGGGLAHALALNEREVGPRGRGDALGGWWVAEGELVHSSFYPAAFHPRGFGIETALVYARRAGEAANAATRG